ncbi:hypothetical protein [Sorangium cellulosum]|uniref:Uncharacterized protein n=1 Tax=Sorangium cellulosum TaxID=56 RepID=A0A150QKL6_SORCE|nr:hypothetical protein [Sorangium cellulosum]KYF68490.1 hypothetical protein BE15_03900 [Sorangium cellulosum]
MTKKEALARGLALELAPPSAAWQAPEWAGGSRHRSEDDMIRPAWQRTLGLYAERLGVSVDEIL